MVHTRQYEAVDAFLTSPPIIVDGQDAAEKTEGHLLSELKVNRILQSQGREMSRTRVGAMQY